MGGLFDRAEVSAAAFPCGRGDGRAGQGEDLARARCPGASGNTSCLVVTALARPVASGVAPAVCGAAMVQGAGWRSVPAAVAAAFASPRRVRRAGGWWPEAA
jgi:hypothetical protein